MYIYMHHDLPPCCASPTDITVCVVDETRTLIQHSLYLVNTELHPTQPMMVKHGKP